MDKQKVGRFSLNGKPVSEIITEEIILKYRAGGIAVISQRPYVLTSAVRKRWIRKLRQLKILRARLLAGNEASRLSSEINFLNSMRFSTRTSRTYEADVYFMKMDDLLNGNSDFEIILITEEYSPKDMESLFKRAGNIGKVTLYEQ